MSENISLKMGVRFAASLNMGKNLYGVLYIIGYNQHKLYKNDQKVMDCELPLGMIHFSLILQHNMRMKYAEEPFNMQYGYFFCLKRPSKWVHFQTRNTHIRAFFYTGVAPPPPPPPPGCLVNKGNN